MSEWGCCGEYNEHDENCVTLQLEKLQSQLAEAEKELERFTKGNSYLLGVEDGERHVNFQLNALCKKFRVALEEIERGDSHAHECDKINTSCDCDQIVAGEALTSPASHDDCSDDR